MGNINRNTLRKKIVSIGLPLRVLVLVSPFVFKFLGGFRHDEFRDLTYLLLPLSFYIVLYILKYILKIAYKYPLEGKKISALYFRLGFYGFIALNAAEFILILNKALFGVPDIQDFLLYIGIVESVFGIYSVWFIADLFSNQPDVQEPTPSDKKTGSPGGLPV